MWKRLSTAVGLAVLGLAGTALAADSQLFDVVVYGGTAGGVIAATAAARAGKTVVVIEPQVRVGGMVSGGLDKTDLGDPATIGGMSKEFFDRCFDYYKKTYGDNSEQAKVSNTGYFPEPKIAQQIFEDMMKETGKVTVMTSRRLTHVAMNGPAITSIDIADADGNNAATIAGKMFIDDSYEGDLMAMAHVPYRVGREGRSEYNESLAGVSFMNVAATPREFHDMLGQGDFRVQAYNIRGTITNNPALVVPFPKPAHYDPTPFLSTKAGIIKRNATGMLDLLGFLPTSQMPNLTYDPNASDHPGLNYNYVEGTWADRQKVYEAIRDNWLSYFYMLQSDPDMPAAFHDDLQKWGLPKDEFTENGNITPQVYVREARRMVGQFVLTQNDEYPYRYKDDGICLGSYTIDCHMLQVLTTPKGTIEEGGITAVPDPYEIPYRSLVPKNVNNLLVASCISATHVAYSSLRMEPVYMMIGHAAGLAASMAIDDKVDVQHVDAARLRLTLEAQKALIHAKPRPVFTIDVEPNAPGQPVKFSIHKFGQQKPIKLVRWNFDGTGEQQAQGESATFTFTTRKTHLITAVAVDDSGAGSDVIHATYVNGTDGPQDLEVYFNEAASTGHWDRTTSGPEVDRRICYHTVLPAAGKEKLVLKPELPVDGTYTLCLAGPWSAKYGDTVPITVTSADGTKVIPINQRSNPGIVFRPVGTFHFKAGEGTTVEISTKDAGGPAAFSALRFVWVGK